MDLSLTLFWEDTGGKCHNNMIIEQHCLKKEFFYGLRLNGSHASGIEHQTLLMWLAAQVLGQIKQSDYQLKDVQRLEKPKPRCVVCPTLS